ncbi:hypothetical protein F511_40535 [Dorcoceras hygrometricum]|uniref:Uncharacterized protein n=1 Tax=Dorcoceras hygrometricum TaxID=472368 RepID=A0A2Z7BUE1_9LAMI|nr:hypothetical protein F511_40535 [Dorcoceras hygrometricum]
MNFDPADGACVYLRNIPLIPYCDARTHENHELGFQLLGISSGFCRGSFKGRGCFELRREREAAELSSKLHRAFPSFG